MRPIKEKLPCILISILEICLLALYLLLAILAYYDKI